MTESAYQGTEKLITLPPAEELRTKLEDERVLGLDRRTDKFYAAFIDRVATEDPLYPEAINLSWETAKMALDSEGMPPVFYAALDRNFNRVAGVLIADPASLEKVIEIRREFLEELVIFQKR